MVVITLEKAELEELIESAISRALERYRPQPDRPMSKAELQAYLGGKSDTTIYRMIQDGLPHIRCGRNGPLTFYRSQVDDYLQGRSKRGGLQEIQREEGQFEGPELRKGSLVDR